SIPTSWYGVKGARLGALHRFVQHATSPEGVSRGHRNRLWRIRPRLPCARHSIHAAHAGAADRNANRRRTGGDRSRSPPVRPTNTRAFTPVQNPALSLKGGCIGK